MVVFSLVSSNLLKLSQHFGITLLERWIGESGNGFLDQCDSLLGLLCRSLVADSNVHQVQVALGSLFAVASMD